MLVLSNQTKGKANKMDPSIRAKRTQNLNVLLFFDLAVINKLDMNMTANAIDNSFQPFGRSPKKIRKMKRIAMDNSILSTTAVNNRFMIILLRSEPSGVQVLIAAM